MSLKLLTSKSIPMKLNNLSRNSRRGAALIEYSLLIAGVALISSAAVSVFGHKTNDLVAATAAILPGAHGDDNGAFFSGKLIETTGPDAGAIALDINGAEGIVANSELGRLGNNLLGAANGTGAEGDNALELLVIE